MDDNKSRRHNLILDNREKLTLSGVIDVSGFDEETVSTTTEAGKLVIRGSNLHISKLNLDSGEVEIEGNISSMQYTQSGHNKSFLQRVFS